jgi:hypothetical protein|tara:strand:+ start:250 stop:630 length:381 start_codon:yes stop_codon:yes gene_type:complete
MIYGHIKKHNFGDFMKKSNLMVISVAVYVLAACGSSEDVDAVAAGMMTGSDPVSEKDAKCLAKSLKNNVSNDQWNTLVREANGEKTSAEDIGNMDMENLEKEMEKAFAMLPFYALASKECGVPLDR